MGRPKFVYSMSSHQGLVRRGNEDCCAAAAAQGVFVVCDGMGGAAAGEVASRLAVSTFLGQIGSGARADERLRDAITAANQAVHGKAEQMPELQGMGTTLVAALLEANELKAGEASVGTLWIAHVGDSRCYLRRGGSLQQMTEDHSVVEEQVRAGYMTQAEADVSPLRNVITRAVGTQGAVEPEIQTIDAYPGDLVLLASDGLNRELSAAEIDAVLSGIPPGATAEDLRAGCDALVAAANAHGGHDNVTVLLLSVA